MVYTEFHSLRARYRIIVCHQLLQTKFWLCKSSSCRIEYSSLHNSNFFIVLYCIVKECGSVGGNSSEDPGW